MSFLFVYYSLALTSTLWWYYLHFICIELISQIYFTDMAFLLHLFPLSLPPFFPSSSPKLFSGMLASWWSPKFRSNLGLELITQFWYPTVLLNISISQIWSPNHLMSWTRSTSTVLLPVRCRPCLHSVAVFSDSYLKWNLVIWEVRGEGLTCSQAVNLLLASCLLRVHFKFLFLCRDSTDLCEHLGSPGGSDGKKFAYNARDLGLIPDLGRSPLQYSCLENSMDGEA